ncbi:MAG: alpha/beta hydrolase, partial [Lactobacillus iners]|nr:alpha/beta hydrolase [Lactobacillus iners]
LTLGMTPGQVDSLNKILKQLQNEGALTNTYLTGHSLGGYLAMTALVEARDKGYTGIKKAVTFNAPKIRGNLFNKKMQRVAKEANLLTQRGEAIHYAVSNDNVISAVGNFIGAKSVGKSANGHSSRTYFEDRIMQFGFKQGRRKSSMAGTGDQEANLKKVLAGFSNPVVVTQADAYPAKIKNHIVTEVGVIPDLTQCILNRNELPLAKVEDKTSSMHLYQPYQIGKGQCGSLSLTYQDGSKKTYFVTIDVQKAKPAGVVTSKGEPLVQKAKPAGVITSKGDPLVELTKADHATELSHLVELLEKKVPSIKQKQPGQQISSNAHINAKKLPQLGADCRILVCLVSFLSIFIIGSSKYVINKDKK